MRIELLRSGGFANLRVKKTVDTSQLPAEQARELSELIEGVDLEDLARRSPLRGRGADRFQYDLTVIAGEEERHVSLSEDAMPAELRPLIQWILKKRTS